MLKGLILFVCLTSGDLAFAESNLQSFEPNPLLLDSSLVFDVNVPALIKNQMLADLKFMSSIRGQKQTPLHRQIFGPVSGASYQSFFQAHIQNVGLDSCGDSNAVACVIPFGNPNKMWVTQNFIKFKHPQIARLMVMYHEARHSESDNGNWPHDTCPDPFLDSQGRDMKSIWTGAKLAGEPACDSTALGSYGSSTILLKNIGKFCDNCNSKVKMDADLYATDQLGRIDRTDVKQEMLLDFAKE